MSPYIICAGANMDPETSDVIAHAVEQGWIHDLGAEALLGPPTRTYRSAGPEPDRMDGTGNTRIDLIPSNTLAKHMLTSFVPRWDLAVFRSPPLTGQPLG